MITMSVFTTTTSKTKDDVLIESDTVLTSAIRRRDVSVTYPTIYLNSCTIH